MQLKKSQQQTSKSLKFDDEQHEIPKKKPLKTTKKILKSTTKNHKNEDSYKLTKKEEESLKNGEESDMDIDTPVDHIHTPTKKRGVKRKTSFEDTRPSKKKKISKREEIEVHPFHESLKDIKDEKGRRPSKHFTH